MKKYILVLLLLLSLFVRVPSAQAQYTPTPNIGMEIPSNGSQNWNVPLNYNFNRLDQLLSGQIVIPALHIGGNLTVDGTVTAGSFVGVGGGTFPTISGTPSVGQCAYWPTTSTIGGFDCPSLSPGGLNFSLQYKNGSVFGGVNFTGLVKLNGTSSPPSLVDSTDIAATLQAATGCSDPTKVYSPQTNTCITPGTSGITALTGDVTATGPGSAAATVVKVNGVTISGTPASGNVITATSPTGASWGILDAGNIGTGTLSASRLATSGVVAGSYNFPSTVVVDNKGRVTGINGNQRVNGCSAQYRIVDYSGTGTVIPDSCPDTQGSPNNGTLATAAPTIGTFGALYLPNVGSGPTQTITTPLTNWGTVLTNFCTWPRGQLNTLTTTTTGTAIGGFTANNFPALWGASTTQGYQILTNGYNAQPGNIEVVNPFGFSASGFSARVANYYGGCHTLVYVSGSPNDTIYMDGIAQTLVSAGSGTTHTSSSTVYSIGGYTDLTATSGFRGWINYVKVWPVGTTLTAAQIQQESQSVSQEVSNRIGYPIIPTFNTGSRTDTVVCGGDSLVAGYNGTAPWCNSTYVVTNRTYNFVNYALGGQTALEVAALFGQQLAPAIVPSARTILINDAASNDIRGGLLPSDTFNAIAQFANEIKTSSNALLIQGSMISRITQDANKNALNAFSTKNWKQLGIAALNDVAEIPALGADGAYSNTNCFQSDGIHLQGPGATPVCTNGHSAYAIMAQTYADTINYLDGSTMASPTVVSSYPYAMTYKDVVISATTCSTGTCAVTLPSCDHMDDMPFYVMNYGNAGTITVGPPTSSYYQSTGYNLNGGTTAITVPANTTMKFNEVRGAQSVGGCSWISQ